MDSEGRRFIGCWEFNRRAGWEGPTAYEILSQETGGRNGRDCFGELTDNFKSKREQPPTRPYFSTETIGPLMNK